MAMTETAQVVLTVSTPPAAAGSTGSLSFSGSGSNLPLGASTNSSGSNSAAVETVGGRKRPRSRNGCFTCRQRKKRCDEVRPMCGACARLQLDCTYPVPGMERKNKRRKSVEEEEQEGGKTSRKNSKSSKRSRSRHKSAGECGDGEKDDNELEYSDNTGSSSAARAANSDSGSTIVDTGSDDKLLDKTSSVLGQELEVLVQSPPQFVSGLSPNSASQLFGQFEQFTQLDLTLPDIPSSPSAWCSLNLDDVGVQLFDYFRHRLAPMICVSTQESNSFLNVFVPMAQEDTAVLYSLVAWAGFHRDKGQLQDTALLYLNKAIKNVKLEMTNTSLASMLLICAAEICSGDVMHWDKHLTAAAKMIKQFGGLDRFVGDKTLRWLASNFAYHDLLASSTCARNTHFPSIEYDKIMTHGFGLDALIGCCQPLFKVLAEISDLAVDSQQAGTNADKLRLIKQRANVLEQRIEAYHPDPLDMINLTAAELEQQLSLFEVYQLTARLHLRQAVLRLNCASVEMQCLNDDLNKCLDTVLETKVEGGLVFPLFVAGITCTDVQQRELLNIKFERYYERNYARNIKRARHLMEEVWNRDDDGTKHVDWYGIIQNRGWDICFA